MASVANKVVRHNLRANQLINLSTCAFIMQAKSNFFSAANDHTQVRPKCWLAKKVSAKVTLKKSRKVSREPLMGQAG